MLISLRRVREYFEEIVKRFKHYLFVISACSRVYTHAQSLKYPISISHKDINICVVVVLLGEAGLFFESLEEGGAVLRCHLSLDMATVIEYAEASSFNLILWFLSEISRFGPDGGQAAVFVKLMFGFTCFWSRLLLRGRLVPRVS